MTASDEVISANARYENNFTFGNRPMPLARKVAVVACMDVSPTIEQILGLKTGDAHIIRNAGGIVTDDAIRSLIISHHGFGNWKKHGWPGGSLRSETAR